MAVFLVGVSFGLRAKLRTNGSLGQVLQDNRHLFVVRKALLRFRCAVEKYRD